MLIMDYLEKCYECGWYGVLYDLEKQGIPLILPIQQDQMAMAITKETKLTSGIYKKLGLDKKKLAREINFEIELFPLLFFPTKIVIGFILT